MSLNKKLLVSFTVIALAVDSVLMGVFGKINQLTHMLEDTQFVSRVEENHTHQMQVAVIQVQQWLTDISATRGADGLDDGFKKAADYARQFHQNRVGLHGLYQKLGEEKAAGRVDRLGRDFEAFYQLGQDMASAYIENGTEAGNQKMRQFDPFAEKLFAELAAQLRSTDRRAKSLQNEFLDIQKKITMVKRLYVLALALPLVLFFATGYWLTSSIAKPLGRVAHVLEAMAQGDLTKRV